MNRLLIFIISLFFLNNCSLNENSRIWKDKKDNSINPKNIKKIFSEKKIITQFNQELKLDLTNVKIKNKIVDNQNNYGFQNYSGSINKVGNYKFSKLDDVNELNFKPIFLNDGLIFFDKKGSIIRYDNNQKVLWKKNHYSKLEKKLKPKLNFVLVDQNLLITDSISKYYSINVNSGELIWSKNNIYPFNSEIKRSKNKVFVVDYKNTLRCYNINDGSECWNLPTENSFTISSSNFSLIIDGELIIFTNSIGDVTAVDIDSGLITWQLPTQSSSIINETYNFKISKLVSDNESIYFSNNKNEFYSIDAKTGTTNWINEINSNLTPIISSNLIFTVSNEGYLYVIEKNNGNIIRISDLYIDYKIKKRKNVKPIGFAIGDKKLYLTNTDGKMIIVDLNLGKVIGVEKIAGNFTSRPFIFNQSLFVIRNGSIIQYN
ncbi:PQQ-like beta-propeller repeat protein [Candidatus Pelagibacter sp.]|nr:PQQ-like beta-propeller repeat protein [Candidatus Pelagibacter sp.]MDC0900599.1 PQQ-like beta-propeller repeat protein [Candidatus Pelagibacter sp.]MDC1070069.1 PQQ-like beta-propeller repeat protein [Candidatus Pelagibacter sp.]